MTVLAYSPTTFEQLLSNKDVSMATPAFIKTKFHLQYFNEYFQSKEINAATIVVEPNYIDRDYLEDFASYYVRCFYPYQRFCTRLHFFSCSFDERDLQKVITNDATKLTEDSLQSNYIGFIVLRNLPQTIFGRTCLKTYGPDGGRRGFPIVRSYSVSMFGIPLSVDTLGFQEQDSVAGACATSALWTVFQGTGKTFQHRIPSPAEISNLADHHVASEARRSPSRGLTDNQAIDAIESIGLEALEIKANDSFVLRSTVYAYLRGNVPLYLGLQLITCDKADAAKGVIDFDDIDVIGHAVAVTGYSLPPSAPCEAVDDFRLLSSKVNQIYAHDDQVGPFARMAPKEVTLLPDKQQLLVLTTTMPSDDPKKVIVAHPELLIVPLYHKIRIPFHLVQSSVRSFDVAMKTAFKGIKHAYDFDEFVWDIHLVTGNDFVQAVRTRVELARQHRYALATKPLPRFFWKASLTYKNEPYMTILFDATDLEQGQMVVHVLEENDQFCGAARKIALFPAFGKTGDELEPSWPIWTWLNENDAPK